MSPEDTARIARSAPFIRPLRGRKRSAERNSRAALPLPATALLPAGRRARRRLPGAVGEDEVALELKLAGGAALQRDVRPPPEGPADRGLERGQGREDVGERLLEVRRDGHDELAPELAGRRLQPADEDAVDRQRRGALDEQVDRPAARAV